MTERPFDVPPRPRPFGGGRVCHAERSRSISAAVTHLGRHAQGDIRQGFTGQSPGIGEECVIPLRERLRAGPPLLSDGAMGTMLLERGLAPGACPELMNITHPGVLEEIGRAYLDAGAEIIQTNTFGASPLKLASYKLDSRAGEINAAGVRIARSAAQGRAYAFACCGPSGRLLKPYGDVEPEAVEESYRSQVAALVKAGIDAVNFETMIDLAEAEVAVRAAKAVDSELVVCATMTFQKTRRGWFTVMGNSIADTAARLAASGADVVGSNCGNGSAQMVEIAAEFRRVTELPISIRPNAGLPVLRDGRPRYPEAPEQMGENVAKLVELGVRVIGGCCGTTPEHIRAFRAVLAARQK